MMTKIALGVSILFTVLFPPWRISCIPHPSVSHAFTTYGTGSYCVQRFGLESFLGWMFIGNGPTILREQERIQRDLAHPTPPLFVSVIDWQLLGLEWCVIFGVALVLGILLRRNGSTKKAQP